MPMLTESEARHAGRRERSLKATAQIIREATSGVERFDVFLSHSITDRDVVIGAMLYLRAAGLTVYVDWDVDKQLDRSKVDRATAGILRDRMNQCDSLLYLWSKNAQQSRWMPWELGYFDGRNGKVAVMPLLPDDGSGYTGFEYVALYPTVDIATVASRRSHGSSRATSRVTCVASAAREGRVHTHPSAKRPRQPGLRPTRPRRPAIATTLRRPHRPDRTRPAP
jgi:hypothetical protein